MYYTRELNGLQGIFNGVKLDFGYNRRNTVLIPRCAVLYLAYSCIMCNINDMDGSLVET